MKTTKREERLDSLRGVAAMLVAAGHCLTAWTVNPVYNKTYVSLDYSNISDVIIRIAYILFNGSASVITFFVLSGFVLTKSLLKIKNNYIAEFFAYIIKRTYRVIPTVIISFIPLSYFYKEIRSLDFIKNMLLIKYNINGSTWTLQIEMIASILIFVLFILSKNIIAYIVSGIIILLLFFTDTNILILKYLPAFYAGSSLIYINKINFGCLKNYVSFISMFLLLIAEFAFGYNTNLTLLIETIFATLMISGISDNKLYSFLDAKILKKIGVLSFSFYLYHLLGVHTSLAICSLLGIELSKTNQIYSAFIYMLMSIPVSFVYAIISYRLIEIPSMESGANLSNIIRTNIIQILQFGFGRKEKLN